MRTPKLIAGAAALCLSLSACASITGIQNGTFNVSDVVADIRDACVLNANSTDIKALIDSGAFKTADAIVTAVCKTFTTSRTASRVGGQRTIMVKGIPVRVSPAND